MKEHKYSYNNFKPGFEKEGAGVMSYIKVEPTIADDIKQSAYLVCSIFTCSNLFVYPI